MRRPTKLQLQLARKLHDESGAHMRARLSKTAFLRSLFWQGEHGGQPATPDPAMQRHAAEEQLMQMRRQSLLA